MKFIKQIEKQFKIIIRQINIANIKKYKYAIGAVVLILIIIPTVFFVFKKPSYVSVTDKELAGLNSDIKKEVVNNKTFDTSVLEKLASLLTKRKDALKKEFYENPSLVNKHSLESDVKGKIPSDLLSLVEKDTKIKGNLEVLDAYGVGDESFASHNLRYENDGKEKTAEVFFSDKQAPSNSIGDVEFDGIYLDNYLLTSLDQANYIEKGEARDLQNPTNTSSSNVVAKEDRVLIVKVKFKDSSLQETESQDAAIKGAFNAVDSYYRRNSFNKYGLKLLEVTDWVTLPYGKNDSCDVNYGTAWSKFTAEAVWGFGYDASKFDRVVYQYYGLGNYCTSKTPGNGTPIEVAGYGSGNSITSFTSPSFRVYAHELGHCLGLGHASTDYNCDDNGNCTWNEYGNPYDIMGSGSDFSVANMYKLGWLDKNRVLDVSKSGRYEIFSPTDANLNDSQKPLLIVSLEKINTNYAFTTPTTPNASSPPSLGTALDYSYYQYYGSGSFMGNSRKMVYYYGNAINLSHLYLKDFDHRSSSYLSIPGNPITIGDGNIEVVSYDNNKIVFDIKSSKRFAINKIDINAPYSISGDKVDEYNYRITAGEKVDLAIVTFANVTNVGKNIRGFQYDWKNADNSGIFNSIKAGPYSVSASKDGITSNTVKIMVSPAKLSKIGLSPNTAQEVTVNQPIQFTASGQDVYSNTTGEILSYSWTGADANGLFVASKPGDYQVKVTSSGYESSTVNIKVKPAPLDHISIDPEVATTIEVGESVQFKAYGRDQYGNSIEGTTYTWTGTDANGLFTSKIPGTYQIKATSGSIISKEVTVTVTPAPLDHIIITPNGNQTVNSGQSIQFTAQGQDRFNNNISGLKYSWIGANAAGSYTGKDAGTYIVKASSGSISSSVVNVIVAPKSGNVTAKSGDGSGSASGGNTDPSTDIDNTVMKPVLTTVTKNGVKSDSAIDSTVIFNNNEKIVLSGKATPSLTVTVSMGEKSYDAVAGPDGIWSAEISSGDFKAGKYTIMAQAKKGNSSSELTRLTEAEVIKSSTDTNTTQGDKDAPSKDTDKDDTKDVTITNTDNQTSSILSNPIFIGVVSVICLAAVSGGSYLLLRRYYNR